MDRDELTPKQEDHMIESGMEDMRELPEKDESVWADEPTEEDIMGVVEQIALENRDLDIRVTKLERGNRK